MKKIYRLVLITFVAMLLLVLASSSVFAVNANSDPFPFKQPNGILISVWQFGDEFLHWSEDANGNLIVFDDEKDGFCFANWSDAGEVSTGELVGPGLAMAMYRPGAHRHTIPQAVIDQAEENRATLTEGLFDDVAFVQAITTAMAAPAGTAPQYADVEKMKRKMLMIHVTFEDRGNILQSNGQVMPKMSGPQIYDLCFGLREDVDRSVNGYYQDLLMTDEVVITPAEVLIPMDGCQGVIEVVLPGRHPNYGSDDPLSAAAMRTAMQKACDEMRINLVSFDTNRDGTLQTAELAIGMIFDGFEYSMGRIVPNFWGVSIGSGSTPAANLTQGIKIASLFAQGAFHRNSGNVYSDAGTPGVIVHEMGHSGYSFQDTYDTGGLSASSGGCGYWSMQASGDNGRLPGEYAGATSGYQCAYNLVRSGFVIPGTVAYGETAVMDNHLDIYLAQTQIVTPVENTPVTNYFGLQYRGQYFLMQQRKWGDTFNYDQGAFGYISSNTNTPVNASIGGMLIQHVDLNVPTNRISNKPGHYRAGYEEAHGGVQGMQQRSGAFGRMGDFGDLWGVSKSEFSYRSDPLSGIYDYGDGRVWVNALTPIPHQNTPSGVNLTEINWDPITLTTSFLQGMRPEIDVQPQGATVLSGTTHKMNVAAHSLDGGDISYQWYCNGSPIAGATAAAYTALIIVPGQYDYHAVVTNTVTDRLDGQRRSTIAASATATLEILPTYQVYLEPQKTGLTIGSTFYVDVMLEGVLNYTQLVTEVVYDADLLEFAGYDNLKGWAASVTKPAANKVAVRSVPGMNMVVGAPCASAESIVTLKFTVKGNFAGSNLSTEISLPTAIVSPPGGHTGTSAIAIPLKINSGTVTLNANTGVLVPSNLSTTFRVVSTMAASSLPRAHKHGYIHEGWLLNGNLITDAQIADSSIIGNTIYASYKLEYDEPLTAEEKSFLDLIDYDHVDYLAKYISKEIGNRITFSPRRDLCVDWIKAELTSYGYQPITQDFTWTSTPTVNGIIWINGKHYVYHGPTWAAAASTVYKYDARAEKAITGAMSVNWANSGQAFVLPPGDYANKAVFVATNSAAPSAANAYNAALALQNAGAAAVMFQTLPMAANGNTTYSRLANTTSGTAITIPVGSTLHYETSGMLSSLSATTEVKLQLYSSNVGVNVIAKLPAAIPTEKTVYITSHHDTTLSGPGMNDNGSGVIMTLEMARAFKNVPFDYNLVFVIFDAEESGLRGAYDFCARMTAAEKANFVANYNMDMIATSQANCQWMFMNISDTRISSSAINADNPNTVAVAKEYEIYNTTMKAASKMGFVDNVLFVYDTTTDHYAFVRYGNGSLGNDRNMMNAVEYDWRSNRQGSGFETLYHRAGDTYELNYSTARMKTQADIISLAVFYGAKGHMPAAGVAPVPWAPALLQPLQAFLPESEFVEEIVLEEEVVLEEVVVEDVIIEEDVVE